MNYDEAHEKLHPTPEPEPEAAPEKQAVYRAGWERKGWISSVNEDVFVGVHLNTAQDEKFVFYDADDATGSYEEYTPTDEDKNATDWYVWGEGPWAEEAEQEAEEAAETFEPPMEGGAGEPAPYEPGPASAHDEAGAFSDDDSSDVVSADEPLVDDDSDSYVAGDEDVPEDDNAPLDVLEDDGGPVSEPEPFPVLDDKSVDKNKDK